MSDKENNTSDQGLSANQDQDQDQDKTRILSPDASSTNGNSADKTVFINQDKTRIQTSPSNPTGQVGDVEAHQNSMPDDKTRIMTSSTDSAADKTVIASPNPSQRSSAPIPPDDSADVTRFQPPTHNAADDRTRINTASATASHQADPASALAVPSNFVLKERFLMEKVLGVGGMGMVYKAKDKLKVEAQDKEPYVAIKVLNEEFKTHPEAFIALQRESRKTQRLSHPNIVKVFDFDKDNDMFFMTMEYMEGKPLDRLIKQYSTTGLPMDDVWSIIQGMCSALSYAHAEKIVHADLKPGNIFVTTSGMPKIFDFGIARAVTHIDRNEGGSIDKTVFDAGNLGALTPAYASYEMLKGSDPDVRDDIYALGCISYELLTGAHPFDKIPADEAKERGLKPKRIKSINKRQWQAIERALAFERDHRISTVDHFYHLLTVKAKSRVLGIASFLALSVAAASGYYYVEQNKPIETAPTFSESDIRDELEFKIRLGLYKEELAKLLADPLFTTPWEVSVWDQFSGVSGMVPEDDSWRLEIQQEIYSAYLSDIGKKIKASDFKRARVLIKNAERYAGDLTLLQQQQQALDTAVKADQQRSQQAAKNQQLQQQKRADQQAEKQLQQKMVDEYNLAFSNVQRQLECRARLNMRDFDIAIKKLKSLDSNKYSKAEPDIIKSLVSCISAEAKSFPERATESKKYALRIFNDSPLIAAIEIIPRDSCDSSIAGLGSRGQRATCNDEIKGIGAAPELVVIPTGKGIRSFAISRYEISVAEFKRYCSDTMACSVASGIDDGLPLTGQSLSVINGYIRWLSKKTGKKYRLPVRDEWVHAATANKVMEDPNRNCFFSSRQIQKGDSLVRTTVGKQNGWGLVNYLGNAEELVYEKSGKVSAVGGSYKNAMDECKISYRQPHNGQPNDVTGFRVVRELTIK